MFWRMTKGEKTYEDCMCIELETDAKKYTGKITLKFGLNLYSQQQNYRKSFSEINQIKLIYF